MVSRSNYPVGVMETRKCERNYPALPYGSDLKVSGQSTMGISVFRRVQNGEPAITRELKRFSNSMSRPSTCLARITGGRSERCSLSSIVCKTGIIKQLGVTKQDGGKLNGHHS